MNENLTTSLFDTSILLEPFLNLIKTPEYLLFLLPPSAIVVFKYTRKNLTKITR